jgi:hypothetical protein
MKMRGEVCMRKLVRERSVEAAFERPGGLAAANHKSSTAGWHGRETENALLVVQVAPARTSGA